MKGKKLYIMLYITIFALVVGSFILIYNLIHYTIDIDNPEEIVKVKYSDSDGYIYYLTDKQAIEQFIDSINGMTFFRERIDIYVHSFDENIAFYNEDGTCVYYLYLSGDACIRINNMVYKSDKDIDTTIFDEYARRTYDTNR